MQSEIEDMYLDPEPVKEEEGGYALAEPSELEKLIEDLEYIDEDNEDAWEDRWIQPGLSHKFLSRMLPYSTFDIKFRTS